MRWAGVTIWGYGIPVNGRRVLPAYTEDDSFYWNYDEDDWGSEC